MREVSPRSLRRVFVAAFLVVAVVTPVVAVAGTVGDLVISGTGTRRRPTT